MELGYRARVRRPRLVFGRAVPVDMVRVEDRHVADDGEHSTRRRHRLLDRHDLAEREDAVVVDLDREELARERLVVALRVERDSRPVARVRDVRDVSRQLRADVDRVNAVLASSGGVHQIGSSPDPFIVLSLAQTGPTGAVQYAPWAQLPVVRDASVAVWDPVDIALNGTPTLMQWQATDRDLIENDPMAVGTVDLLQVARSCESIVGSGAGGTIRFLAVRAE